MSNNRKQKKAKKELLRMLAGDNFNIDESDPESTGKSGKGDIVLNFKGRTYPIEVERKESIPNATLEEEKDESAILMFRKNREKWKVYMDLDTLLLLLLNNRS
jgi:hypothetical protein